MEGIDGAESDLADALDQHGDTLAEQLLLLDSMPQVRLTAKAVFDRAVPKGSVAQKRGAICRMLCCGVQMDQKCNDLKGEKSCATVVDAVRLLRLKVLAKHGAHSCLQSARERVAAEGSTSGTTSENALEELMKRQLAMQRGRAALARAAAHAAECEAAARAAKEKHAQAEAVLKEAEEEVMRLEGKRRRCTSPHKERPPHFEKYSKYDLSAWLSTTGEIMNRRSIAPVADVRKPKPPEGEDGALRHWRRGLVGCVCDWSCGSAENVAILIVRLVNHFDVKEAVLKLIGEASNSRASVDAYIVGRVGQALHILSKCQTEQQRREFGVLLRAVAPATVTRGDSKHGMVAPVASRLGEFVGEGKPLPNGSRKKRGKKCDYAFEAAVKDRKVFDEKAVDAMKPKEELAPGDTVLCRGQLAKLEWYDVQSGECWVKFMKEGCESIVKYSARFHEKNEDYNWNKRSARLQRPQPSLMAPPRSTRKDAVGEETLEHVRRVYELTCPISPHQKDERKRYLGRHIVQSAQAMIQTLALEEIYRVFVKTYPIDKLSFTTFKRLKPWNLIKAYRETCLCRVCELFRLFIKALQVVAAALKETLETGNTDSGEVGDAEAEDEAAAAQELDVNFQWLVEFCALDRKSKLVDKLLCGGQLLGARIECINGECSSCGFKKYWSRGLRPQLIDAQNNFIDGTATVWEQEVRWETLKGSGSTPSDGSTEEDKNTLRVYKTGTMVDFLDSFEAVSSKFPAHRHLVVDTKVKVERFLHFFRPGMLWSNYDWSEKGVITPDRQIQSEYWSLTSFSLFISITSHLVVSAWLDRCSHLRVGTEVTVEPEGSPACSLTPAPGSFWAKIHVSASGIGEDCVYSVTREDGSVVGGVLRERIRERKMHTIAFVNITDEKRQDAATTQHMLNKQFEHWLKFLHMGKFWAWVGHSDNASHFKSGAMMHYWTQKVHELDFLKGCWIEFGCPGHGKGPWDGMGAVMKQTLKRDMTNNKVLTASGYVTSPKDVAEHLRNRFQTDEWKAAHDHKSIHEIIVTYSNHDEIVERPPVEHEFEQLSGKMTSFSYIVLGRDVIGTRTRSCWCEPCLNQLGRQTLTAKGRNTLVCDGCESPFPLPWREVSVKDLGTGLAGRRREAQSRGAELAKLLKKDGFLAIQARERWSLADDVLYRPGHFWLAQAPNELVVRRITTRETINGQPFHPGDYMIRLERYFERDCADETGLKFEEWKPELVFTPADVGSKLTISAGGKLVKVDNAVREHVFWDAEQQAPTLMHVPIVAVDDKWVKYGHGRNDKFLNPRTNGGFIINSTELRAVNFSMDAINMPHVNARTRPRRSGIGVVNAPAPKKYKMAREIDAEIRGRCW